MHGAGLGPPHPGAAPASHALRALLDGVPAAALPLTDRGFRYGDGLFETLRIAAGEPVWWDAHLARLARGCSVLGLAMPEASRLAAELRQLCGSDDGVLRLALTRSDAAHGYAPQTGEVRRVMTFHPGPGPDPAAAGLAIGWATLQLGIQPRLAGLKHLNRLEQVLAAAERRDAGLDELLLCDADGAVTSAIAANLFLVRGGRLETPLIDRCGVAGTCRQWILDAHPECRVLRLQRGDVEAADELFLCNSVRGILPVARLGPRALPAGPVTQALQRRLGTAVPAFAAEPER